MVREWGGGKIAWRAVARLVLPEEVGPERAIRMGGWLVEEEGGEVMGWVLSALAVGGKLESPEVGIVGREDSGDYGLEIDGRCS